MLTTLKPARVHPPRVVAWLGYGGVIPFIVLGVAAGVAGPDAPSFCHALLGYGAVILSFVGALHWSFAMTLLDVDERRRTAWFIWSVIPALLGWVALLTTSRPAAAILIAGFVAQYWMDRRLTQAVELPPWYMTLRRRLTAAACCCLAVGFLPT